MRNYLDGGNMADKKNYIILSFNEEYLSLSIVDELPSVSKTEALQWFWNYVHNRVESLFGVTPDEASAILSDDRDDAANYNELADGAAASISFCGFCGYTEYLRLQCLETI